MEALLRKTPVSEVAIRHRTMLVLDGQETISVALKKLAELGYRSAPVIQGNKLRGFVDGRDVITSLLKKLANGRPKQDEQNWEEIAQHKQEFVITGSNFLNDPVSKITNESKTDPCKSFQLTASLMDVMVDMVGLRLHRVLLMKEESVYGVLSISDVVNFVCGHMDAWSNTPLATKSASELIAAQKEPVVSMRDTSAAIRGFELMAKNQISGVAVVDESGRLVGNLSAADVSQLVSSRTGPLIPDTLFLPVHVFLLQQSKLHKLQAPVTVGPKDTLPLIVKKMALYRVHRLWVLDADGKPIGVITPYEVCPLFLN